VLIQRRHRKLFVAAHTEDTIRSLLIQRRQRYRTLFVAVLIQRRQRKRDADMEQTEDTIRSSSY
jgi:hypothetical protein